MWRKGNPPYTVDGNVNWCSHYGKQYGGSLKTKNRIIRWSSNPTPGHISRRDENSNLKRYMHSSVHSSSVIIAKTWKQPKCPSTDDWFKTWCIHLYKGILLSHRKEWNTTIWSNMDGTIILSEVSQKEKDKYYMISLICGI